MLLEDCQTHFQTQNLYQIFQIKPSQQQKITNAQLKKLYYKLALKYHPDKNADKSDEEKTLATKKFQILGKIHKILSNQESKDLYDETGEVVEEGDYGSENFGKNDPDQEWDDYWRTLYPKVTKEKLQDLEKEYKNSAEELSDLKKAYTENQGDMDKIMDSIMFSTADDESRFCQIFNDLIAGKEIESFKNFTKESASKKAKRSKRLADEAEEAIEHEAFLLEKEEEAQTKKGKKNTSKKTEKNGKNDDFDLIAVMQERQAARRVQGEAFLNSLEAKYCKPKKVSKKAGGSKK